MKGRCAYVHVRRWAAHTFENRRATDAATTRRAGLREVHEVCACTQMRARGGGVRACACVCVSASFLFFVLGWDGLVGFATCRGILSAVRGGLVNMQRTSKLNQTAKLSILGG